MVGDRVVDVIKEGQVITMLESKAREEELFVLRVHEQKNPIEALPSIESRRRVGKTAPVNVKTAPKWHSYQSDYLKNNVVKELIDNFHWEVTKARKARNLTRLQLANVLRVPEHAIKLIETGELPSDDFVIINKVQAYLGINLRRDGKSFDVKLPVSNMSNLAPGPAYIPKPDFNRKDLSLSDLQKIKENREKATKVSPEQENKDSMSGDDIQLFESH